MMIARKQFPRSVSTVPPGAAIMLALTFGSPGSAQAIEFSSGELSGNFDTTVSYGLTWRVDDPDPDNLGIPQPDHRWTTPGNARSLAAGR